MNNKIPAHTKVNFMRFGFICSLLVFPKLLLFRTKCLKRFPKRGPKKEPMADLRQ